VADRSFAVRIAPMAVHWRRLLVAGLLDVLIGVLALAWPGITVLALGLTLGIVLLMSGFAALMFARVSVWSAVLGVISIFAALICFVHPGAGVFAILFGAAFWFLLTGFADLTVAMTVPSGRLYWGVLGALSIVAGLIMLASPGIALATVAALVGICFLVRGAAEIGVAWRVRGITR
jgi:uncharacterized membrane protein HdeD (DUF308 family)